MLSCVKGYPISHEKDATTRDIIRSKILIPSFGAHTRARPSSIRANDDVNVHFF